MSVQQEVRIARRFLQSIRIDTDLGQHEKLEGFICTESSAEMLCNMARHIKEKKQGAFTWTGPYGSGKSSLAVALGALLNGDTNLRIQAEEIFGEKVVSAINESLPRREKGWQIVPVVGRRAAPAAVIGEAISSARLKGISSKPKGGWTDDILLQRLAKLAEASGDQYGGVFLLIDEMGKFLEESAQSGTDIYIFQQLAELASRSEGRLIVVGMLHQAFGEYMRRLYREMRAEWNKVQGRFIDLALTSDRGEQIALIAKAVECDNSAKKDTDAYSKIASLTYPNQKKERASLEKLLRSVWPLDPVTSCLLGPMSRRHFGQNQRSVFGFLNSAEPFGFRDFLRQADKDSIYTPDLLWDYLKANLEPAILASPDSHRWALVADALDRCAARGGDALHERLLKNIGVIELFKNSSGIAPSLDILKICMPDCSEETLEKTLNELIDWSLIIFKKFMDSYGVFAGSDFDIEKAVQRAMPALETISFDDLNALLDIQPLLAKKHYHKTGVMRWYGFRLISVAALKELQPSDSFQLNTAKRASPDLTAGQLDTAGQFLFVLPTSGETQIQITRACKSAIKKKWRRDLVVGISPQADVILSLAQELEALRRVRSDTPALSSDAVARRELDNHIALAQERLESQFHSALAGMVWMYKGSEPKQYSMADLSGLASKLAAKRFHLAPTLYNELLNCHKPSMSAAGARNALLRHMVSHRNQPLLGMPSDSFPAERGLYESLLANTKLHRQQKKKWGFAAPSLDADTCTIGPLWKSALSHLREHTDRNVEVTEIYDLWRNEPYGVKAGLLPILIVAFILSQGAALSIYREGIFRADFDDVDIDYLLQDSNSIQLRWLRLSRSVKEMLALMAETVSELSTSTIDAAEPLEVAQGLVGIHDSLPKFTRQTRKYLTRKTLKLRQELGKAQDPNNLLFHDLPEVLTGRPGLGSQKRVHDLALQIREGLKELKGCLRDVLGNMRKRMVTELQVPNDSESAVEELRARASNIRDISGDFQLEAFITRISTFDGSEDSFAGIASLAAGVPPHDWTDANADSAAIKLVEMSQRFLQIEQYAHVKGRKSKRNAIAVTVGMSGHNELQHKEFSISDTDERTIDVLLSKLRETLDSQEAQNDALALAALAKLSLEYMDSGKAHKLSSAKKNKKGKA